MLKLELQYFGHLMRRTDSLEKTLILDGKDRRQEEKGTTEDEMVGWHHRLKDMSLSKLRELLMDREACVLQFMGPQKVEHDGASELN